MKRYIVIKTPWTPTLKALTFGIKSPIHALYRMGTQFWLLKDLQRLKSYPLSITSFNCFLHVRYQIYRDQIYIFETLKSHILFNLIWYPTCHTKKNINFCHVWTFFACLKANSDHFFLITNDIPWPWSHSGRRARSTSSYRTPSWTIMLLLYVQKVVTHFI